MNTGEVLYVGATLLAVMGICTAPALLGLSKGGPRYRAAVKRQLAVGWAAAGLVAAWLVLGGFALGAGPEWFKPYCRATWGLMIAYPPMLFLWVRNGNRTARAAMAADRASG